MNRNTILDIMEEKTNAIFNANGDYQKRGKRGMMVVAVRDSQNSEQWDSSCRSFGTLVQDFGHEGEMITNNGVSYDGLVHGKIAFTRRTLKNSGTHFYQVFGSESFWRGAVISKDENCICAYSGLLGVDDEAIAQAGVDCYEKLKG